MLTNSSARWIESPVEQRGQMRFAVALPATAVIGGKNYGIRVLNVALGGAMFETSALMAARSRLIFRCGTIAASATVEWQSGGFVGVRFDRLISDRDVAEQRSRSSAVAARWEEVGSQAVRNTLIDRGDR